VSRGERGPTGDHGQAGETGHTGVQGETGEVGKTGPMGPAYTSWLTRHVLLAYGILCFGFVASLAFTVAKFDAQGDKIRSAARVQCDATHRQIYLTVERLISNAVAERKAEILQVVDDSAVDCTQLYP